MNKLTKWPVLFASAVIYVATVSCNGGDHSTTAGKAADSAVAAPVGLRKGKIWDKENIVKIPMTASENQLSGNVKTVAYKEFEYSEVAGDNTRTLVDSGVNTYDKAGHLVEQNEYYADRMPKWNCIYRYDEKNKPMEWKLKIYEDNMNSSTTFRYDAAGNKVEEITVDSNKEYSRRTTYKYDGKGNEVEADMYDYKGELKQLITYEYDARGFQVAYVDKEPNGTMNHKLTCNYDDRGNKIAGADYSSDTAMDGKWIQKNDAQGRRVETDYLLADGKLAERRTIKYDDHGFAIEFNTYKADGKMDEEKSYSYKNEYDKTGNIVRQTEIRWKNGKQLPVTYTEFSITYY